MMTVEEAKEAVTELERCCLTPVFDKNSIVEVLYAFDWDPWSGKIYSQYRPSTDRQGIMVLRLSSGKIGMVKDGEDYSGHG